MLHQATKTKPKPNQACYPPLFGPQLLYLSDYQPPNQTPRRDQIAALGRGRSIILPNQSAGARRTHRGGGKSAREWVPSTCGTYRQSGGAARARGRSSVSRARERETPPHITQPHPPGPVPMGGLGLRFSGGARVRAGEPYPLPHLKYGVCFCPICVLLGAVGEVEMRGKCMENLREMRGKS